MRIPVLLIAVMLLPLSALAAEPTTAPSTFDDTLLMPAKPVGGLPFKDVLELIKADQPGFKYVLFRGPGVPADYPVMPDMQLDRVSVRMFLMLVQSQYPVGIERIGPGQIPVWSDGAGNGPDVPPLLAFRIDPSREQLSAAGLPPPKKSAEPTEVHLYRLTAIIDRLADPGAAVGGSADEARERTAKARAEAMANILSLVETALGEAGGPAPSLKIHQPTQTVIFNGTSKQREVVEQVMRELLPGSEVRTRLVPQANRGDTEPPRATQLEQTNEVVNQLRAELEMRTAMAATAAAQRAASEQNLAAAQRELAELERQTKVSARADEIAALRAQRLQYQKAVADYEAKGGPDNPEARTLKKRLAEVEAQLTSREAELAKERTQPSKAKE